MSLTEMAIKGFKPKAKIYRIADSHGLCLEISPAGGKLWRWRYYFQGKGQMLALGKYPEVSLSQARKLRDEAREQAKSGQNPTRIRKAQKLRRMQEGENTFERTARRWFELRQGKLNEKYHKQCLERLEPAKRMKQLIGQIFRYATQRGLCQHNPAADLRDILPSAEKKHHPCVPVSELPALLQAIDAKDNDFSKLAMQLLSLTFVRTGELIGAKWEEIDWQREEWNIPKERMKMKRPHVVPLSRQTLAIMKELHKITGDKPYLFYSTASKCKHISNGTVLMALRRMGYQGRMTGHGFRTLASTILNEKNYPPDVIERQLAHEDKDKIRSAYNRAERMLDRKKMMQDYANILDQLGSVLK